MEEMLVDLLIAKQLTIASYESFTGGLFANKITNIPDSSKTFQGTLVSYATKVKINIGNVDEKIIKKHGVVSRETAIAMSEACQILFKTDLAISFTGNAGPTALDNLPIGKCYCAIRYLTKTYDYEFNLPITKKRIEIKEDVVNAMIKKIIDLIKK